MGRMHPETSRALDERAQAIGAQLGWTVRFRAAPGDLFVGITVCTVAGESVVADYTDIGGAAAHAAHWDLDLLEADQYKLQPHRGGAVLARFLTPSEIIAWAEGPDSP